MTAKKTPKDATYFEYRTRTLVCRVWTAPPGAEPKATCKITTIEEEAKRHDADAAS